MDPSSYGLIQILFEFIFYVPVNNLSVMLGHFLDWLSTKQRIKWLAQVPITVLTVRFKPAAHRSQVKHSTNEPLYSFLRVLISYASCRLSNNPNSHLAGYQTTQTLNLPIYKCYILAGIYYHSQRGWTGGQKINNNNENSAPEKLNEPWHEISNNVVCATSKCSDQPAHMRSLIRAFARRLNILRGLSYWMNTFWSF